MLNISPSQCLEGFNFYTFNLSPDYCDGFHGHLNVIRRGSIRIDLKFAKETSDVLSVLLYCEFDNLIQIDKDRNIFIDF